MSGIYSVEDLLKLRASPLICRPPNLPPIEEWMGTQDTSNRRPAIRGKPDEPSVPNETFQKRPTLLDNQRRTTTDPDRIVLGPPRRSFASSNARAAGKTQEGSEESNSKDSSSFHERSRNGDESESRPYERRATQSNGRFGNRQDSEDAETENRRDYDRRFKWAGRDRSDQNLEDDHEDLTRTGFRRDTHSRAKLSQSWFKKDTGDGESRRDTDKSQDWRSGRGRDRDWDRSVKAEADPEWMDSTEPDEPFQVHTQEDFQRWKEKMKAGGTTSLDKTESGVTTSPTDNVQEKPAKKVVPVEPDDSMDKFFARFEAKGTEQKTGAGKVHGKTRFASLFSPPAEQNKQVEAPPMPTAERPSSAQIPSSTDADQAGFARILEMLQTRSNNPTPQNQDTAKPRTPLHAGGTGSKAEPEARPSSQDFLSLLGAQNAPRQSEPAQSQPPPNHERYAEPRSPTEQPPHTRQQSSINKDEVLLNLLRQASLAPKPQPPPPPPPPPPPAHQQSEMGAGARMPGLNDPNSRSRGQMISPVQGQGQVQDPIMMMQRRETGRSMFDESPISMYQNEPGPREALSRRPTNGTQPGFTDDAMMAMLRTQRLMPPPQHQGLPPGLQRPPGLDQLPRPNPTWPSQPPPRQPSLPPGLSNVPRGVPSSSFMQTQQITNQQNMQQQPQQQRPQQQRKYTGDSVSTPGVPNLPPVMYPPPGFIGAGPPPGFPGHPARYQAESAPPQGISRVFMDMYGEIGGRGLGLRGGTGNGGMPPYR
ncbi:uncharacterized protein Z518_03285 [Rhinocladiella mackenziei CBS 650.93]|uniref:Uncharacterized protein n=1 Tax=Rhinocladiella mackenziei CBS 650.93 TaxID=1442369 RepID=A0A0D2IRL8_9EURO|nr:uncharacterized protein Z518_03285 [Rhinocladiella mackenziei CBS 650.93]KIX08629.1 hypothetical protein Z518_03285 [Rhinocladiella mackenziei CBS 650.93]